MRDLKKWLSLLLVVALAFGVFGLAGCTTTDGDDDADGGDDEMADGTYLIDYDGTEYTVTLIEEGKIIAGSDTAYPPFEEVNAAGEVEGFDVDLLAAIGDEIGLETEFLTYNFDALIVGVQTGAEFDLIASAMTIKPERDEEIDFTDPYFNAGQSLAVRNDSDATSLEDLAGSNIGVQSGTTGEAYTTENLPEGSTVVPFENILQAFQALQNGDVDGVVNDKPVSEAIAADEARGVMIVGETMSEEQYGFGVSEDNPGLTDLINAGLAAVVEDGTYDEIIATWFAS